MGYRDFDLVVDRQREPSLMNQSPVQASAVFEFLVPLSLLLSHPAYRRHSLLMYERQSMRVHHNVVKDKTLPKVNNVLGIEIANPGEQAYFDDLSRV
ncbi:hypothetical protein Q1695_002112 [Nippostrongylus brasiliensis]|nr:hypothetical protein Q1695_002112 [Nippostrongylus brasiliensis]